MNKYSILTPIPAKMSIEPGQEGYIKKLESAYKSANFETDGLPVIYDNNFESDVIGSRMVSTILKFKSPKSEAHIELNDKCIHEKVGIVTHKSLAIILNIRSQMVTFFFGIIEDSDLPPIIGWEVRDQYPADYMDYDLTDKQVYVTSLKVLNRRAKEKDFVQSFFAKSPTVYEDLKRLHGKTGHGSFLKIKTALTAAKKWQPGFDNSLAQIIKRCKLCTHHSDIIDTEVDQFNEVVQVETISNTESNPGHILMTDLFSGFTATAALPNMESNTVINTFFLHWVIGPNGDGYGRPTKYVFTSTGRQLDNKEGRKLIEERDLTWKYPKIGKVITLSPDCQRLIQSFNVLKVKSPEMPEDTLLAEAVFAHNSKLKKGAKLSPCQQVKGTYPEPAPKDDTAEPGSTNRLIQLGAQAQEKGEKVINQNTFLVSHSAEIVGKGNSSQPKFCKCGFQFPNADSLQFVSREIEHQVWLCKTGFCKPPLPPDTMKKGDHNFFIEKGVNQTPLPPDVKKNHTFSEKNVRRPPLPPKLLGKRDHNFFEKDVKQPPLPPNLIGKGDHNFFTEKGVRQPPLPPKLIGKGDHNFFTEKGVRQPPLPPNVIGKGDHNFYKENEGGGPKIGKKSYH